MIRHSSVLALPWIACPQCGSVRPQHDPCRHLTDPTALTPRQHRVRQGILLAVSWLAGFGGWALYLWSTGRAGVCLP